jgi:hypothetical protein
MNDHSTRPDYTIHVSAVHFLAECVPCGITVSVLRLPRKAEPGMPMFDCSPPVCEWCELSMDIVGTAHAEAVVEREVLMSDTQPVDIGHGLTAALRIADDGLEPEGSHPGWSAGDVLGVLLTHPCSKRDGQVVQDFIPVNYMPSRDWELVSREPITLSPSVNYVGCCGLHGFVREGRWVPA